MIIVLAKVTPKPGKKAELFELVKGVMAKTRQETGCISYTLMDDPQDPTGCMFVEEWESKAALLEHSQTQHVAEWRKVSADLLGAKTAIRIFQAEETKLS